jgi:hypothetical protein
MVVALWLRYMLKKMELQGSVAYGMTSESQMSTTRKGLKQKHGAPNCIFSDDILHLYASKDFQCEPEYQHQNLFAMISNVSIVPSLMDCMGTPPAFWILCLFCIIFLLIMWFPLLSVALLLLSKKPLVSRMTFLLS